MPIHTIKSLVIALTLGAICAGNAHAVYVKNDPLNVTDPTGKCGAEHQNKDVCVFAIKGAGPNSNSNNKELASLAEKYGGVYGDKGAKAGAASIREYKQANPDAKVVIMGVSRGGNEAVATANLLAGGKNKDAVKVDSLVTFDPHRIVGDKFAVGSNVQGGANFYQRNPASGILGAPTGYNPYRGRPVDGGNMSNTDLTGQIASNTNYLFQHNSIVRDLLEETDPTIASALAAALPH